MPFYAGKTTIAISAHIRRVASAGTDFFTIRYPRVLRKASLTHAFEGFDVAALEIYPPTGSLPYALFLISFLHLWILLGGFEL